MKEIGNVLSLFDGASCFQQALVGAGVKYGTYYASEIEKQPMVATQYNFPDTVQLGDVCKISGYDLPKIDIIVFGFPCQSHSIAGKGLGFADPRGQLFFEAVRIIKECRTKNPDLLFIAENVKMSKQSLKVISEDLGVYPQLINSALLTAQNRERNYWSNISTEKVGFFDEVYTSFPIPKDKGILLKDILQPVEEVAEKYYLSDKMLNYLNTRKDNFNGGKINYKDGEDKASCINASSGALDISDNVIIADRTTKNKSGAFTAGAHSGGLHSQMELIKEPKQINTLYDNNAQAGRIYSEEGKSVTINANGGGLGGKTGLYEVGCIKFGRTEEAKATRKENMKKGNDTTPFADKEITGLDFEKMNTLTCAASKDNLLLQRSLKIENSINNEKSDPIDASYYKGYGERGNKCRQVVQVSDSKESGGKQPYQQNRIFDIDGINPALDTNWCGANLINTSRIRRLTPKEVCRLQSIDDNYFYDKEGKNIISDSAIYKAVGNGFTVKIFEHFLQYIK